MTRTPGPWRFLPTLLPALAITIGVASPARPHPATAPGDPYPSLPSGKEIFDESCRSCHESPANLALQGFNQDHARHAHAELAPLTDAREKRTLFEYLQAETGAAPMPNRSAWPKFHRPLRRGLIVCAHRGFSGEYPENTLIAMKAAADAGADMVELDVFLSQDGQIVLLHDETLDRTTDGTGLVRDFTLAQLRKFDAGSWKDPKFQGEPIPTLKEVLEAMKGRLVVNIEIKHEAVDPRDESDAGIEARVVRLVEDLAMIEHVIVTSFDHLAIRRVKERNARIATGLLHQEARDVKRDPVEAVRGAWADGFVAHYRGLLSAERNASLAAALIPTMVYTVNDTTTMRKLIDAGVRGIITNHPDRLIEVLGEPR